MLGDLHLGETIAVVQLSAYELLGFRQKGQDGLKAFLALILRVITLPGSPKSVHRLSVMKIGFYALLQVEEKK